MSDRQAATISVKKSDGTIVKMTLAEFRDYKAQKSSASPMSAPAAPIDPNTVDGTVLRPNEVVQPNIPATAPQPEPVAHNLPMVEESIAVTSITPTIVGEQMKKLQHTEESLEPTPEPAQTPASTPTPTPTVSFTSPLEEEIQEVSVPHSGISDANETLTNDIVAPIAFLVSEEVEPKLKALVLSRVKEIRTDEQVKENALLAVENGGLGLDETKVTIFMHAIEEGMKKKPVASEAPSAKARLNPVVPGISTIDKSALKPVEGLTKPVSKPDAQKILSSLIAEDRIQAEMMTSGAKVQMHDVVARPRSMGPVDEMMNFSLVDFRRLGANPTGCADALIQKFNLLKTESFLLYLNGRNAWFKSPLYSMYLEVLEKSLNMNKSISLILGREKDSLQMEELKEVVRVSQSLNF